MIIANGAKGVAIVDITNKNAPNLIYQWENDKSGSIENIFLSQD